MHEEQREERVAIEEEEERRERSKKEGSVTRRDEGKNEQKQIAYHLVRRLLHKQHH